MRENDVIREMHTKTLEKQLTVYGQWHEYEMEERGGPEKDKFILQRPTPLVTTAP